MKLKKIVLLCLFLFIFGSLNSISIPKYFSDTNKKTVEPCKLYEKTIIVPHGYILKVELKEPLNISNLNVSDKYSVVLKNDFIYNSQLIAQEGSIINGTIVKKVESVGNLPSQLMFKFTGIYTPSGQNIPISGIFVTNDGTGLILSDVNGEFNLGDDVGIILKQPVTFVPKE